MGVAIDLANTYAAELTILHVLEVPATPYSSGTTVEVDVAELGDAAKAAGVRSVSRAASLARARGVEVSEKVVKYAGSVADGITDYAKKNGVDLIVVGTRGMGGIKKLLLGSVAEGVVDSAGCSVMVVR